MWTFKHIVEILIPTIVSTGCLTAVIHHFYERRIRIHDYKLRRYEELIEQLANLVDNTPDWEKLRPALNATFFYASQDLIEAILDFNIQFTKTQNASSTAFFQMPSETLKRIITAIRKDLFLKSGSIQEREIRFFVKPITPSPESPALP